MTAPSPPPAPRARSARLVLLSAVVGAAVMGLEVAAPRLWAPRVGAGALVWTVAIATFLGGLAIGHVAGGRLADRRRRLLLASLLAVAGAATLLLPAWQDAVARWTGPLPLLPRILLGFPIAFLPVAVLLGTVPPALARGLLQDGRSPGRRLGILAAAGAVGSVVGTLLAGFALVPALGLRTFAYGCGGLLLLAAGLAPGRGASAAAPVERTTWRAPRSAWVYLAAVAGFGVLALEVLAGRLASDRLGSSIYTWTSVIAVVLTGLAVGALAGGVLADRAHPRALLRWLFLGASAAALLLLGAHAILDQADGWHADGILSWRTAVLLSTTLAFLLPALLLGTLSPVVVRAALEQPDHDGRVVGGLYAAGTLGAVVAAVLLGFVLVPWAGLERLVLLLAFLLASASGTVRGRQPYAWHALLVVLALAIQGPWAALHEVARGLHLIDAAITLTTEDSRHARIRVLPIEERWVALPDPVDPILLALAPELRGQAIYDAGSARLGWRGSMAEEQRNRLYALVSDAGLGSVDRLHALAGHAHRRLQLDRLVHGYVDLQDPTWLGYGYERLYAAALERLWPNARPVRCYFVGGGAYAFQRRLLALHGEDVRVVTAEIDPQVTQVAETWLGLRPDARHTVVHEDARTHLAALAAEGARFDLVFGDAFDDIAIPFHLTTKEFVDDLATCLADDGIYLVNVVDSWASGRFLGAFLATIQTAFPHVRVVSASPRRLETRDTYVVVASRRPLALAPGPLTGPDGQAALVLDVEEVRGLVERTGARLLTDDCAPVEVLLAPVLDAPPRDE